MALDDAVAGAHKTVDANQIDARFMRVIPRIESAELIVADEARGREQPRGVFIFRLARQRRRCQVGGVRPSTLHYAKASELAKDGRTRTRQCADERPFRFLQPVLLRVLDGGGDLRLAWRFLSRR
jgi:hypothetical protein